MPATIRDVARLAGVSSAAVSKVLTNADNSIRVSEATSKRILRAARKLKYRPDIRARFLFQRRTQTIAFITDYSTLGTHYSHMTLSRCANQFLKHDHTTTVLFYDPQETETIERIQAMVEEGRFDGAILVSTDLPAIITSLERRDVPYIIVNPAHARRFDTIMFDEEDNLRLAFNCLLEAGHRHIGYLDYTKARDPHLTVSRRRDAYLRLCHEHHVPPYFFSEDFADVSGVEVPGDLRDLPTGVITYSLDLAQKFFSRVYRNPRIAPAYFSIVSAAEDTYQDRTPLRITGIVLPIEAMTDEAVEKLFFRMSHAGRHVSTIKIAGMLSMRETVHPPASAKSLIAATAPKPAKAGGDGHGAAGAKKPRPARSN